MKISIIIAGTLLIAGIVACTVFAQTKDGKHECGGENDLCCKKPESKGSKELACKLTTPELRLRKETVIKRLKSQVIEKKELANGFQYKFIGSDKMIDELSEFVKTERACCNFFIFDLSFSGTDAILQITGTNGVKDFIKSELEM